MPRIDDSWHDPFRVEHPFFSCIKVVDGLATSRSCITSRQLVVFVGGEGGVSIPIGILNGLQLQVVCKLPIVIIIITRHCDTSCDPTQVTDQVASKVIVRYNPFRPRKVINIPSPWDFEHYCILFLRVLFRPISSRFVIFAYIISIYLAH